MINFDIISNTFKLKYELLNNMFDKFKGNKYRYMLIIDVEKILSIMINSIYKNHLIITNSQKTKLLVGLLNIISHYRHYYYNSLHSINSILLYCSKTSFYNENKEIFDDLNKIIQFLPNMILVPNIEKNQNDFFYLHTMCHIVEHTRKICTTNKQELILNVLGNDSLEYQLFNIVEKTYFFSTHESNDNEKIIDFSGIWRYIIGDDTRINNPIYSLGLKRLLVPYCIVNKIIPYKEYLIPIHNSLRLKAKSNMLFSIIESNNNINEKDYAIKVLNEPDKLETALNTILYSRNIAMKPYIQLFIRTWNKKLKDNKIESINEYSKVFEENNINIAWLLEDQLH